MGNEASKLRERWKREGIWDRYFTNQKVLDIGCGEDKIVPDAVGWEFATQGNGQLLDGLADGTFDVVFSSHFLEHVADPVEGLLNQWRVLKPRGYLIGQIPDEDIYEQFVFPSFFNPDHKYSWTIHKDISWSPGSKNLTDVLRYLPHHKIISMRVIDTNYDYSKLYTTGKIVTDQTQKPEVEAAVEFILQKEPPFLNPQGVLHKVFMCGKCHRVEFVIRGLNAASRLSGWCNSCGDSSSEFTGFHVD